MKRRAVFLDRDGTLIKAVVNRPDLPDKPVTAPFSMDELEFVPDLYESLEIMRDAGFMLIIITNQPDVANGYISEREWERIHQAVTHAVDPHDCFMCRHRSIDNCPMKKPSPMMIIGAADKHGIDLSKSFMVGDTSNDTLAGKAAGCKTVIIDWPYNQGTWADFRVPNLLSAARLISGRTH